MQVDQLTTRVLVVLVNNCVSETGKIKFKMNMIMRAMIKVTIIVM